MHFQSTRVLKRSGMEVLRHASKLVQRFEETGHLVSTEFQCLESWDPEKVKKGEETIHFNGDSTNTELLFQTIRFCKSAQYLRSSGELVSTIRRDRGRKGTS